MSCFPADFHVHSSSVLASHPSHLRSCVPDILGTWERKLFTGTREQETRKRRSTNFAFLNFINKCEYVSCMWQMMLIVSSVWQNVNHVPSIWINFFHVVLYIGNTPTFVNSTVKSVLSRNVKMWECKFWNREKKMLQEHGNAKPKARNTGREGSTGMRAHPCHYVCTVKQDAELLKKGVCPPFTHPSLNVVHLSYLFFIPNK